MVTKAVGVDVGVNGGIVALNTDNSYTSISMPKTNKEIAELFVHLNPHVAYVEKVSGYIGKAHPASRMFNFGVNFGVILGALHGLDSEVHLIRPQEWQKPLGLPKRDCRTEHKRELKRVAEKMFPNLKLTLKTCDAALILDYGINKNEQ